MVGCYTDKIKKNHILVHNVGWFCDYYNVNKMLLDVSRYFHVTYIIRFSYYVEGQIQKIIRM